jgi:hypothetical protein
MSHLKISNHEIELFIRSMKTYYDKLKKDHPHSDDYIYNHPVSKEIRYVENTIGKMKNELKVRAMRPHRVTA